MHKLDAVASYNRGTIPLATGYDLTISLQRDTIRTQFECGHQATNRGHFT